jgi:hypothetical protein
MWLASSTNIYVTDCKDSNLSHAELDHQVFFEVKFGKLELSYRLSGCQAWRVPGEV